MRLYAYPHFQHPYAPVSRGTVPYPHTIESMVAGAITGGRYLRYMTHSADFSLGLNPLNLSWTTGLGDRPVMGPLISLVGILSRASYHRVYRSKGRIEM